jgi:hypothetical protein
MVRFASLKAGQYNYMEKLNYAHLSFRELLAQRKLAERALTKKRNSKKVQQIIEKINIELDDRREIKFSNATKSMPIINTRD